MLELFKNSVIVRMQGGIGNQLFIFAFAKTLSLQKKKKLFIDTESGFKQDTYNRKYFLDLLNIYDHKIKLNLLEHFIYKIILKTLILSKKIFNYQNYIDDSTMKNTNKFKKKNFNNYFVDGYFQSENFFKEKRSEIKKLFVLQKVKFSLKKEFYHFNRQRFVAIHIRDFSIDQKKLGKKKINNVNLDYYIKCIKYFSSKIDKPQFIIFSENTHYFYEFKKLFPKLNFKIYQNLYNYNDLEILFLMSSFRNIIIANSTFSWWAAWLNNKSFKKKILSPKINKKFNNWNSKILLPRYFKQIQ